MMIMLMVMKTNIFRLGDDHGRITVTLQYHGHDPTRRTRLIVVVWGMDHRGTESDHRAGPGSDRTAGGRSRVTTLTRISVSEVIAQCPGSAASTGRAAE
eukprot:746332-Hanusia_phi.AAC.22